MCLLDCVLAVSLQDERPFVSAKKVMWEMGEPYKSGVELLSFHTVSKVSPHSVKAFLRSEEYPCTTQTWRR